MQVTVAICTWNRSTMLDQTLLAMRDLVIPEGISWELLVVNNNCSDDTDEVILRHAVALPIRRLFEANPGLSNARNLAVAESKGELILWTDDDVLVDSRWLVEYIDAALRWPNASFFGGMVAPWFESDPPVWIQENLGELMMPFSIKKLHGAEEPIPDGQFPVGANMAFRASIMRERQFDRNLGHKPGDLIGCEEFILFREIRQEGHIGIWVGSARVRHYIPSSRFTTRFIWDRYRGEGHAIVRIEGTGDCIRWFGVPRWVIRKYFSETMMYYMLYPWKGRRWLIALRRAAESRGIIEECRKVPSQRIFESKFKYFT